MVETVLVTGGTGFVAGWCIVELLQRGYEVRTTVRSLAKELAARAVIASAAGTSDRLTFFAADLTKEEGWDAAMAGWFFSAAACPRNTAVPNVSSIMGTARSSALRDCCHLPGGSHSAAAPMPSTDEAISTPP